MRSCGVAPLLHCGSEQRGGTDWPRSKGSLLPARQQRIDEKKESKAFVVHPRSPTCNHPARFAGTPMWPAWIREVPVGRPVGYSFESQEQVL
jgi:hypothetical protein